MGTLLRSVPLRPLLAIILLIASASDVAAADPTPAPEPAAGSATSPPTIHAEMEAQHAADAVSLPAGSRPLALRSGPAVSGGTTSGVSRSAGALPNGLSHEVLGYLPYWAVTEEMTGHLDYDLLSTIAYFGVPAQATGTFSKANPGWEAWNSALMTRVINEAHAQGVQVVLTVTMMAWDGDYADMTALLTDSARRAKLAAEIASTVSARNADGVNLDFEPVPNSLQTVYTQFVRDVRSAIGPDAHLSVATTGGAASWDEGYDLAGIVAPGGADALMVMAYDLNWGGSARAGGVAPIDSPYVLDVRRAMADYLDAVPASRIIWGAPYYGRAWTTTSTALNGRTCRASGTCTAASWAVRYDDAVELAGSRGRRWDAVGQVPWYTYWSSTYGAQVQAYYDDAISLDAKHELIEANGLVGVGIWHLTMDGPRRELWDQLWRNYGNLPFHDIDDSVFVNDIIWLAESGVTSGCDADRFCPTARVTRGEMASFLARALDLPPTTADAFDDDERSVHEATINRVAAAGITGGCGARRFCPNAPISRGEMASFLARALDLPPTTVDAFRDDEASVHEGAINRVAARGIAGGCAAQRYCPTANVTREQMSAFLRRALAP